MDDTGLSMAASDIPVLTQTTAGASGCHQEAQRTDKRMVQGESADRLSTGLPFVVSH